MDSNYFIDIKGLCFGFQRSPIGINGGLYMTRYIVYLGWLTLRAHKFYRGDDDRAPHDHPWWFITFPLKTYIEDVFVPQHFTRRWAGELFGYESVWTNAYSYPNTVKAWRFHYRPATYRHIVRGSGKPFWSLVISGRPLRMWGFWPRPNKFVPWRDWK